MGSLSTLFRGPGPLWFAVSNVEPLTTVLSEHLSLRIFGSYLGRSRSSNIQTGSQAMACLVPLQSSSFLPRQPRSLPSIYASPSPRSLHFSRPSGFRLRAFFNPIDDPIVKEALKEPVAFASGMLAGFLRLDLNEDPLKEWLTRTVQASGIAGEEVDERGVNPEEDAPQQIEIE